VKLRVLVLLAVIALAGCAERQDANLTGNVLVNLGSVPARGVALDVDVQGNLAYLADRPYGIGIYDLSNPAAPALVDSIVMPLPYVYADGITLESSGLLALLHTENPIQVYSFQTGGVLFLPPSSSGIYESEAHYSQDILTLAYSDRGAADGFTFVKYQNTGGDTLQFGSSLFSTRYVASTYGFALGANDVAFVTLDLEGFVSLDLSISGFAGVLTVMNLPGRVRDAALSGSVLCLAAGYEGLHTVEVTDPANPIYLGSLRIENSRDIERVIVADGRAYLLDALDGVFAVDITNPTNPELIGTLLTANPNQFTVAGDLVLVADDDMGLVVGQILF